MAISWEQRAGKGVEGGYQKPGQKLSVMWGLRPTDKREHQSPVSRGLLGQSALGSSRKELDLCSYREKKRISENGNTGLSKAIKNKNKTIFSQLNAMGSDTLKGLLKNEC